MAKSALGKGLGALDQRAACLTCRAGSEQGERMQQVKSGQHCAEPAPAAKEFAREALEELVDSIRATRNHPAADRSAGRRPARIDRRRTPLARGQEVGLTEVPVIVRSATDLEVLELSLIENLQRADLNPIEEAQAYARLAGEFGMRQEDIAQKVGRSRAAVANSMRLLDLHQQVQTWVMQDLLSVGHAKVLLGLKAPEEQLLVAETILRRSATVRATERMVARQLGSVRTRRRRADRRRRRVTSAVMRSAKSACSNISAPRSRFITARNAAASRSNITATMICSAC